MGRVDERMFPTYEELAAHLASKVAAQGKDEQYWVGIAGAPGSGKTTLTENVATLLRSQGIPTAVVPMDGYHYYRSELDAMDDPEEKHRRRGAHWTFNSAKFVNDLQAAKAARAFSFPSFDHGFGDPVEKDLTLSPDDRVVLVEGNYVLLWDTPPWDGLEQVLDETWFVEVDLDTARSRIIQRHMTANGNTREEAAARADDNDVINGALVAATAKYAHRVVRSL